MDVEGVGGLVVKEIKWVKFLSKIHGFLDQPFQFFFLHNFFYNFEYEICSVFRMKVDLTKYIEEHLFSFDNAYNDDADN